MPRCVNSNAPKPAAADAQALPADLARFLREELGDDVPAGGTWDVTGKLWRWQGKAKDGTPSSMSWFFITIDGPVAEAIRAASPGRTAAWGSVYVSVSIGATTWRTSLFPSKEVSGYLLPVKAAVRKAERIAEGDAVAVQLTLG
jgi:Domain of unknown function (DUF1905)